MRGEGCGVYGVGGESSISELVDLTVRSAPGGDWCALFVLSLCVLVLEDSEGTPTQSHI